MNVRRIFGGATYLTLASFFGRLLSIVSFPILTRVLNPDAYGVAALAATLIGIFTIIGLSGQDTSYVRCYNDSDNYDRDDVDHFYARYSWIVGCGLGALSAIVWEGYVRYTGTSSSPWVGIFVAIGVAGSILSTFAQVRARLLDRYGALAFSLLVSGVVSTAICIATAYLWRSDEVALMVAVSSYWVLVAMLPVVNLGAVVRKSRLTLLEIRQMMAIGLPLIVNAPGYWIISSADRWFLAANASKSELGIYSVGVTVASIGQMVTSALGTVWNPELFRNVQGIQVRNQGQLARVLTMMLWLVVTVWFGISMFGEMMIKILAGPSFQGAAAYVPWIALAYMLYGINQFLGFGFVLHRKSNAFPAIWLFGVVASLSFNVILVPLFKGMGAALVQCLTYLLLIVITWHVGRPYMPFYPAWRAIIGSFILYSGVLFLAQYVRADMGMAATLVLRSAIVIFAVAASLLLVLRSFGPWGEVLIPGIRQVLTRRMMR